ncbi:MAG: methyltransferase domain-containing protein [Armatimonadetes bacterium]|nr:methyltransferase domain-containing protein [Armatimonadota bacterium]
MASNSTEGEGSFAYLASFSDAEAGIAALELRSIAGAELHGRVARSSVAYDVSPAAYTRFVMSVLAEAASFRELREKVAGLALNADAFRVDVIRVPPRPVLDTVEAAKQLADVISGSVNLCKPVARFAVLAAQGRFLFGRVVSVARRDWHDAGQRPHNFSNSLPVRLARALVNCVAVAGDTLVDPCCGVGTVLIEACRTGVRATGFDIHPRRVEQTGENLAALGCTASVTRWDARKLPDIGHRWDAAVIDLPYGRSSSADDELYADIVSAVARCARRMAVVTGADKGNLWQAIGLRELGFARVPAATLTRHVYLLAGSAAG